MEPGQVDLINPGAWMVRCGRYTAVQEYDPVTTTWRTIGGDWPTASPLNVYSDGVNMRMANQTGCAVGALITAAGTGFTSAPVVTASAGASVWLAIVGGAVGTAITVTNGGQGYVYPPVIEFSVPPTPGIQATGFATISAGAVTSITVTDQGAGYTQAPTITITNDGRDGVGANGQASCVLTGAQTITGLLCTDHGNPLTAVPTLTATGGGGTGFAATPIMCWALLGVSFATTGSGFSAVQGAVELSALGGFPTTTAAYINPTTQALLVRPRKASILATITAGAISNSAQTVLDGGIYSGTPSVILYGTANSSVNPPGTPTPSMGGAVDQVHFYAI
jgi:hypothetical protein